MVIMKRHELTFGMLLLCCTWLTACTQEPDTSARHAPEYLPESTTQEQPTQEQPTQADIANLHIVFDTDAVPAVTSLGTVPITMAGERQIMQDTEQNAAKLYSYFAQPIGYALSETVTEALYGHESLDFMTPEDAEKAALSAAAAHGIDTGSIGETTVYAMTAGAVNALAAQEDVTYQDGSPFVEWTQEEEAYLVHIAFACEGIPVAGYSLNTADGSVLEGMAATVILNKDGEVYFNAANQFAFGSTDAAKELITADAALQAVKDSIRHIRLKAPVSVTECRLQYLPQMEAGQYFLTPAWVFTFDTENEDGTHTYSLKIVDAYTGEISEL